MKIMKEPPIHIEQKVKDHILKDLNPSLWVICLKCGISVICGGFLSLAVCGQFGIGFTHFALNMQHHLHMHTGTQGCALICGAIFVFSSPVFLRLITSSLQFRAILRRGPAIIVGWLFGLEMILVHHGTLNDQYGFMVTWLIAAYLTFKVVSKRIELLNRKVSFGM